MDIEGAEYDALKGANTTLKKTEYVVVECDRDKDAIIELLKSSGFVVSELNFTSYILAQRTPPAVADSGR